MKNLYEYSKKTLRIQQQICRPSLPVVSISEIALNGKFETSGIKYVTQTPCRPMNPVLCLGKSLDQKKYHQ